jgi:hypothetical protein
LFVAHFNALFCAYTDPTRHHNRRSRDDSSESDTSEEPEVLQVKQKKKRKMAPSDAAKGRRKSASQSEGEPNPASDKSKSSKKSNSSSKKAARKDQEVHGERQNSQNQDQAPNENGKKRQSFEIFLDNPDHCTAMVSTKSARKVAKLSMTDGMIREIRGKIKNQVWRKVKFVADEAQGDKLAKIVYRAIKLDRNAPKLDILAFINTYQDKCCRELNARRTYLMGRLEGPALQFKNSDDLGNGEFPTDEQMEMCLKREIDVNDTLQMDIFVWYWNVMLPKCAGSGQVWKESQRHFAIMSEAATGNDPKNLYITPSTEAFAALSIENCRTKWTNFIPIRADHPGKNIKVCKYQKKTTIVPPVGTEFEHDGGDIRLYGEKFHGKYTSADGGQQKFGGWDNDGLMRFNELHKMAKEGRKKADCKVIERASLAIVRENLDITEATHKDHIKAKNGKNKGDKNEYTSWESDDEVEEPPLDEDDDGNSGNEGSSSDSNKGDDDDDDETVNHDG